MPDFAFRLRTELDMGASRHIVESHYDAVFTDEQDAARDDSLARHRAAIVELTKWIDLAPSSAGGLS